MVAVWVAIILAETLHGTLRTLLLEPAIGGPQARQVSVFTGSAIIFLITLCFIRSMRLSGTVRLLAAGLLWVVLTAAFEIALGRYVLGLNWDRLLADYDLPNGGLLGIGLFFMFLSPLIAHRMTAGPPD